MLMTLLAFAIELNMYALVGMIMLIGIVKKNAIMLLAFAIEAQSVNTAALIRARD